MPEISTNTLMLLMLAIEALAGHAEVTTRRIESEPAEVDEEEHRSEHVLDLQAALSELGGICETQRFEDPVLPSFDDPVASARSGI